MTVLSLFLSLLSTSTAQSSAIYYWRCCAYFAGQYINICFKGYDCKIIKLSATAISEKFDIFCVDQVIDHYFLKLFGDIAVVNFLKERVKHLNIKS